MVDPTKSRPLIGSACWPVDLLHRDPSMARPTLLGVVVYHSIWTHLDDEENLRQGLQKRLSHLLSLWKTRLRVGGGTERVPRILRRSNTSTIGELDFVAGSPVVGSHPVARFGSTGDGRLVAGVGGLLLMMVTLPSWEEGTGYEKCLSLFSTSNLLS